ncbi:hypothetical protein [Terrihabitans rhizophilus]|uniref:Uncharacterized protein n=1 Tax=Terrihabitans rhizophilus TaxID=3092662 RepID=A0ABU4RQK2_9HYPH|nr:hypothetical protein [Terrihabitans sp. PJ23]MDX6807128.1 hypothetical protein [Terrihabitans sp. PJ23]
MRMGCGWTFLARLAGLAIVASFVAASILFMEKRQERGDRRGIPEAFVLGERYWRSDLRLSVMQDCGAGVFDLNQKTIDTVRQGGLAYLETLPKNVAGQRWMATPAPKDWIDSSISEGDWGCFRGLDPKILARIKAALAHRGSYYTVADEGHPIANAYFLLVLPDEGLVVSKAQ